MPIYKQCPRCRKRLSSGTTCECIKQRHKEYDRYSRDITSDEFYHSDEWKLTRDTVLEIDHHIDVYAYMTTGELIIANTVHHIEPLKDDWTRRTDIDNLISLSNDTHSEIEAMYKKDKQGTMKMLNDMLWRYRNDIFI